MLLIEKLILCMLELMMHYYIFSSNIAFSIFSKRTSWIYYSIYIKTEEYWFCYSQINCMQNCHIYKQFFKSFISTLIMMI